jgi:ribonuclease R
VEREARQAAAGEGAAADRRDLRELATFTIDPLSASDFDDAISAQTLDDGLVRVWVHIADVSAHVPLGSLLDGEARRRATSVYVPGAVEPMLPAALSNEACSLMAGKDRLAVTAELDFDGPTLKRSAFYRSLIRSDERLDYERVERIFAGLESACEPWAGALAAARGTAAALAEQRQRSAAVTLDSPEPQFSFDSEGNVSVIAGPGETSESHRLIEHLMIAANEAVAKLLERRAVPCLYRVHERPAPARIERLVDQLASLDVPTPAVPEHMSSTQAAALLGEISRLVDQHVLRASARARERRAGGSPTGGRLALTSLVLRSLQQAYYSPQNIGHSGLGSACYCHFTSPIRRYPDLVCHRALLDTLGLSNDRPIENSSDLVKLGAWSSEREREAMTIERDADDLASCFALEAALGHHGSEQVFDGEITGLISAGVFVAFGPSQDGAGRHGPLYEGMLPVRALSDYQEAPASGPVRARGSRSQGRGPAHTRSPTPREWWELGEHGTILHASRSGATLRLGDPIRVRVARVELARGRVGLALAGS